MILTRKIGFILILGILGCNRAEKGNPLPGSEINTDIPKVSLMDLQEQPIPLEKYKGKTVFLNFWASWCKPCIEEMASLEQAQNQLANKGVVFLLASNESIAQINEFSISHGYKLDFVHVNNFDALNIQALPTTFIFDAKGKLVFSEMGARNWNENANINLILNITNAR